ncbi:MAG: 50S ribosomal protein L10 [Actinomycetota bacterium]|nr:50S ribosomal protein L10 [Actinomycetota bacterium]
MPKPQKVEAVQRLKEDFESSEGALLAEFTGLKVGEMMQLRRRLAENGAKFAVVKNTLGRIAASEAKMGDLVPLLTGSTAIAFIKGDAVLAARGLEEMARKFPALVVKGGMLSGRVLDAEQAKALAQIESREVLLAQLAGALQAPLQQLAYLLNAPLSGLGTALFAHMEKLREQQGDAAPA